MEIFLLLKWNTFISTISWKTIGKCRGSYPLTSKKVEFWGSKSKRECSTEVILLEETWNIIST